jgi:hypothetical protein
MRGCSCVVGLIRCSVRSLLIALDAYRFVIDTDEIPTPQKSRAAFTAVRPVPRTGPSRCYREVCLHHPWAVVVSGVTDHQLDKEPSSALLAVASFSASPNIAARQPRSAQSCCATAPAVTRRGEVVVLAVISILLFALSFRMIAGLFRRRTTVLRAFGSAAVSHSGRDRRIVPALSACSPSNVSGGRRGDETADRHSHTRRMDTAAERRPARRYLAGY